MDFADLQEVEAEGLELGQDAIERRRVWQQAGEHGLGALMPGHEITGIR
jgi:hypothetical protein